MITTNQIYKDLIQMIKTALTSYGLNWQVIQSYQQTMGNLKPPFIMLHRLTASNYGWQYGKDKRIVNEDGTKQDVHVETQIEVIRFQIEAYRDRKATDTAETITATDVIRLVARWFMSDTGIDAVQAKGYQTFRISKVFEEYYKAVNDIYQVNPHFHLDLVTKQEDVTSSQTIDLAIGEVKKI